MAGVNNLHNLLQVLTLPQAPRQVRVTGQLSRKHRHAKRPHPSAGNFRRGASGFLGLRGGVHLTICIPAPRPPAKMPYYAGPKMRRAKTSASVGQVRTLIEDYRASYRAGKLSLNDVEHSL